MKFNLSRKKELLIKESVVNSSPLITPYEILVGMPFYSYIDEDVTDLSFNGKDLYLQSNKKGRQKINLDFSADEAFEFIKRIANITQKNFSYKEPILDVSFNHFRINAVHPLLAKDNSEGVTNFAIRILSPRILIKEENNSFAPKVIHNLLGKIIEKEKSIIISGSTGTGKTEFQKYLASFILDNSKVILIEDTYETFIKELFPNLDVSVWLYEDNDEAVISINKLLKVALRNNPDWLIVAEVRGKEGYDLIKAASSGLPFITTIHSEGAKENLQRLLLISTESNNFHNELFIKKIISSIQIGIHLEKVFNKKTSLFERYIKEIVEYYYEDGIKAHLIYEAGYDEETSSIKQKINGISSTLALELGLPLEWPLQKETNGKRKKVSIECQGDNNENKSK